MLLVEHVPTIVSQLLLRLQTRTKRRERERGFFLTCAERPGELERRQQVVVPGREIEREAHEHPHGPHEERHAEHEARRSRIFHLRLHVETFSGGEEGACEDDTQGSAGGTVSESRLGFGGELTCARDLGPGRN